MKNDIYRVLHIYEDDYGCEERLEGTQAMVQVVLVNENGQEKTVKEEDAWMYQQKIQEKDKVILKDGRVRRIE